MKHFVSKKNKIYHNLLELYDKDNLTSDEEDVINKLEKEADAYRDQMNSLLDKIADMSKVPDRDDFLRYNKRDKIKNVTANQLRTEIPSSFKESYDCLIMDNDEFFDLTE